MSSLLLTHIILGSLAMLAGLVAVLSKKGRQIHIYSGRVFVLAMLGVVVSAAILSIQGKLVFLGFVTLFSFYLTLSGWLVLMPKLNTVRLVLAAISLLIGCCMLAYAVLLFINGSSAGIIILVFGLVLGIFSAAELRQIMRTGMPKGKQRIRFHLQRMGGAFIATSTAVLVTNVPETSLPEWVVWLLPTAIGTILIIRASRKWS